MDDPKRISPEVTPGKCVMRHPWNNATPQEKQIIAGNLRSMMLGPGWTFIREFGEYRMEQLKLRMIDMVKLIGTEDGRRDMAMDAQECETIKVFLKRPLEWISAADGLLESQSEEEADG